MASTAVGCYYPLFHTLCDGQTYLIVVKRPFAVDGLDILRAICRPHYGATALKVKIELATDLCFTHVPSVTHRNQLQLALNAHLQGLAFLTTQGQGLGESMAMRGLMILTLSAHRRVVVKVYLR